MCVTIRVKDALLPLLLRHVSPGAGSAPIVRRERISHNILKTPTCRGSLSGSSESARLHRLITSVHSQRCCSCLHLQYLSTKDPRLPLVHPLVQQKAHKPSDLLLVVSWNGPPGRRRFLVICSPSQITKQQPPQATQSTCPRAPSISAIYFETKSVCVHIYIYVHTPMYV